MKMYKVCAVKEIRVYGRQKKPTIKAIVSAESREEAIKKFTKEVMSTSDWTVDARETASDVYTYNI